MTNDNKSTTRGLQRNSLLWWVFIIWFSSFSTNLQAQEFKKELNLALDSVIGNPDLWKMTKAEISTLFSTDMTEESSIIKWSNSEDTGRQIGIYPPDEYALSQMLVFDKKIIVHFFMVECVNDQVVELTAVCTKPGGFLKVDEWAQKVDEQLSTKLSAQAKRHHRFHGSELVKKMHTLIYAGDAATACLDFNYEHNILRFSLAPPKTDPMAMMTKGLMEIDLNAKEFYCNLDVILQTPRLWEMSPLDLEAAFGMLTGIGSPCFQWLNDEKTSARFSNNLYPEIFTDLRLFDDTVPVNEVVINFEGGKVSNVDVSIYNRGDAGRAHKTIFVDIHRASGSGLTKVLGVRPTQRKLASRTAVKLDSWIWNSPHTVALLECNADGLVKESAAEFIRLKMGPVQRRNQVATPLGYMPKVINRVDMLKAVKREENGDVFISGIPMVDQGAKGYCVVASCQRLLTFMKIPCDQHELAQVSQSSAIRGTRADVFVDTLRKIDDLFQVRFKALLEKEPLAESRARAGQLPQFSKTIAEYVNKGQPLLWSLVLGVYPEEPSIVVQEGGGHMRLIVGYNVANEEILFSDSWGAGHELKRMKMDHALKATMGVYLLEPR